MIRHTMEVHLASRFWFLIAVASFAGCSGGSDQEYFEGVVYVDIEIDAHDPRISADLLYWWFGSTVTWTLKDGNYRLDYADSDRQSIWYRVDENREYQLRSCDDHITWTAGEEKIVDIVSVRKLDETREIAGYATYGLEVVSRTENGNESTARYWYAPELKVNPEWASENRALGFDEIYRHIDSLIIGSEDENEVVSVKRFATRIDVRSVDESMLEIPDMEIRPSSIETLLSIPPCPMPL